VITYVNKVLQLKTINENVKNEKHTILRFISSRGINQFLLNENANRNVE
jgi:hypothetical protein